ncbi:Molybdopterin molybdenumtransferase [Dirofilaria immitis]
MYFKADHFQKSIILPVLAKLFLHMSLDDESPVTEKSMTEELFKIPITHHLLPICLMAFILLTLLLACLYDCKINRDCCRKRSGSGSQWTPKTGIYLYDGETGESRIADGTE